MFLVKTNFLIFLTLKDKNSCFLFFGVFFQENLIGLFTTVFSSALIFHHCFTGVFIFDCIFLCNQLSLPWLHFCCFFVRYFFFALLYREYYGFERAFFPLGFSYLTLIFHICDSTVSATNLRDFYPQAFLHYTPSRHCTNLLSRVPWKRAVLPWSFRASQLWFKAQTWPICLFEPHSVQQKVILGRFYLCIRALRNTISTSRFWTHFLIAIYVVTCMSYPLGHGIT